MTRVFNQRAYSNTDDTASILPQFWSDLEAQEVNFSEREGAQLLPRQQCALADVHPRLTLIERTGGQILHLVCELQEQRRVHEKAHGLQPDRRLVPEVPPLLNKT